MQRLRGAGLDSDRDGISSVLSRTHLAYSAYLARAPFFPPEVGGWSHLLGKPHPVSILGKDLSYRALTF